MTQQEINELEAFAIKRKDSGYPPEILKLIKEIRLVQESFYRLINDGEFTEEDEERFRNHFKGTVCE